MVLSRTSNLAPNSQSRDLWTALKRIQSIFHPCIYALPQILLLATVAYASAGSLYSGYGGLYGYGGYGYGGYGLGHGAAIAPAVTYAHAPVATSYANTYKVSSQTLNRVTGRYDTSRGLKRRRCGQEQEEDSSLIRS